jgi:hypothetical protein
VLRRLTSFFGSQTCCAPQSARVESGVDRFASGVRDGEFWSTAGQQQGEPIAKKWCSRPAVLPLLIGVLLLPIADSVRAQTEQQRQQQIYDEQRRRDEEWSKANQEQNKRLFGPQDSTPSSGGASYGGNPAAARAVEKLRKDLEKQPALAADRNPLLGQWKLDKTRQRPANALAELNAMLSRPVCQMFFGEGIWDFRPKVSIPTERARRQAALRPSSLSGAATSLRSCKRVSSRSLE